ncbi:unnamed protein product [Echinostoma caproni]|uniref:Dynein light chain n=1 Tax=Echinostoma caproni TaxID=27848 RepID=A0A183B101_9TREM|nr:unnamed protein product [Echinostoma caproni]
MESKPVLTDSLTPRQALIKNVDLSEDGQTDALLFTAEALDRFEKNYDIACYIKRGFERKYGGIWHCVAGQKFVA